MTINDPFEEGGNAEARILKNSVLSNYKYAGSSYATLETCSFIYTYIYINLIYNIIIYYLIIKVED